MDRFNLVCFLNSFCFVIYLVLLLNLDIFVHLQHFASYIVKDVYVIVLKNFLKQLCGL